LYFNSIAMVGFCYCARRLNKDLAVPSAVNILRPDSEQESSRPKCSTYSTPADWTRIWLF